MKAWLADLTGAIIAGILACLACEVSYILTRLLIEVMA